MNAELEMESKATGSVLYVEVLLSDGTTCWYPRRELTGGLPMDVVCLLKDSCFVRDPRRRNP